MRPLIPILLLVSGILLANTGVHQASAFHDPRNFRILANSFGWNSTVAVVGNPPVTEFRTLLFTITVEHDDAIGIGHDFAIYTNGTRPAQVSSSHTCSPPGTNGCWARSGTVTGQPNSLISSVSFTPTVPPDDFTGPGGYEYYCQFHPASMHGHIKVLKNPDINGDHIVDIVDVATAAFSYGATAGPPPSSTWSIIVDLDNSGRIDIVDVATAAFYFGKAF